MKIGKAIRKIRQDAGFRQRGFANMIGISQSYLSQIENGYKLPSTDLLQVIAEFARVPLPILFWFAIEIEDVSEAKQYNYHILKPVIDSMINQII